MPASTFMNKIRITHIGTATAILDIDGINFLTDPFFTPGGNQWQTPWDKLPLKVYNDPALKLNELPHIDAVLLSHENHLDNLDEFGRQLLDGRRVFTTNDGAKNLAPRPSVLGFSDWEEKKVDIAGVTFDITATPCKHWPGHECVGFILHTESFGKAPDGRLNAVYFSGDTVYVNELAKISEKYHIVVAMINLGKATFYEFDQEGRPGKPGDVIQVTMDGRQAAQIFRDIKADVLVPMHFESWNHFKQSKEELKEEFKLEGILPKVRFLEPGKTVEIY